MFSTITTNNNTSPIQFHTTTANKRKSKQEESVSALQKAIKLDINQINTCSHLQNKASQKKITTYQITPSNSHQSHKKMQQSTTLHKAQHITDNHPIQDLLESALINIRDMDIEYAITTSKADLMPENKRLPIHGNLVCVEKIYKQLLVPELHLLMQQLEPIKDQKHYLAEYAMKTAELVKKYKVAQCDEMTHLMASHCLQNTAISLFKMIISFYAERPDSCSGKLANPATHMCLIICPSHSGCSVQAQSQWYETEYKSAHSDLFSADGTYHQPSYITTSDIYIADPCQHEFWTGNQWQEFITNISDQYITPTGKDYKKIQVKIEPYHLKSTVTELPAVKIPTNLVKRKVVDYSAMPAYSHLEEFSEKTSKKVRGEKQRGIELTLKRLKREQVEIPSWETVKKEYRKQWTTHLIRFSAWKMKLDVKVLYRDDLKIIDPKSADYYLFTVDLIGKSEFKSESSISNMANSFNHHKLPFPEPSHTHFSPSEEWLPGHIRHLIKTAFPKRALSNVELIKVLRVINPMKSNDTYLLYMHEYFQSKLANKQNTRLFENCCSTLSKGNIPLPAIEGMTQWSTPAVRKLAKICADKFGGIQPETIVPEPPLGKRTDIPHSPAEFLDWFLKKLTNNRFNFSEFSGKLKYSNYIVTIIPIEGIEFNSVPQKPDWLLYYIYHYGFDKKEIYEQAPTSTLYQMLIRIQSREKHTELYNNLLYAVSTRNSLRSLSYTENMKRHGLTLPEDLTELTLKGALSEMHKRAIKLQANGWLAPDIDLSHL